MVFRIISLVLCFQTLYSQQVDILIDSLADTTPSAEKASLSVQIASELAISDWERARYYLDIAKENAIASDNAMVLADFYYSTGEIYYAKDAVDIALENYLKAYKYYSKQPASDRFKLENNLAIVYARSENKEQALHYFRKVYNFQKKQKDTVLLASILNNMGTLYLDEEIDSSLAYYNTALALSINLNDTNLNQYIYTNLGRAYAIKKDFENAKSFFSKAQAVGIRNQNPGNKAWLYTELAGMHLEQNQADSAAFYAKNAEQLLDSVAPLSFQHQRATQLAYKSLLEQGAFEEAAIYFEEYATITDSLNLEDKRVKVERLLVEEEYRNREKIRQLEEAKKESRNYIILLALLAALLLLGIIVVRYRNKWQKVRLEKQLALAKQQELNANLELKNKELIGKAMVEMHRTEIVSEILQELKEVKRKAAKKETQYAIDTIAKRLKRDTSTNLWEEFETRFEQVHESFYQNLLQKHPELTSKDKRLCALLKLNLTTKEIAQLTGQSPKSVENARTRLRKKLELTHSETDLSLYLAKFN
ncbi:tetratricopeptide repeat protein [Flavobacteriaceae bacterium TK19130]|nr:tetratricopeptide repeat protein [Thermobacterium salinum]